MALTATVLLPAFIEREKTQTLTMGIMQSGALLIPSAATINIYDDSSNLIVDGGTVTISGTGAMTYSVNASVLPSTLSLSDKWRIEWVVTVSGVVETVYQEAHLVLYSLYPVISDYHLLRKHTDLDQLYPDGQTDYQLQLDDAWESINAKLLGMGRRPYLILNQWALKDLHTYMTLERIFRDLSMYTAGQGKYAELANFYAGKVDEEWATIRLNIDYDEDGQISDSEEGEGLEAVIFLNASI